MSDTKEADVCYDCANCGVAEVDAIQLEECDGCDLVKYCSDKCRGEHREQHEEECKKRAKELHDKKLFRQPDISHRGECPICFLPMPLGKAAFYPCCCKVICDGCVYVHHVQNGSETCAFCREPMVVKEENEKQMMNRIKANDPAATCKMGRMRYHEGDHDKAFDYYTKAAELGDVVAHYWLGCLYMEGEGVEKDEEKEVYHWEKAAIGGHPKARHNLACVEAANGNMERAVKHSIIAANLGHEGSMKSLWEVATSPG